MLWVLDSATHASARMPGLHIHDNLLSHSSGIRLDEREMRGLERRSGAELPKLRSEGRRPRTLARRLAEQAMQMHPMHASRRCSARLAASPLAWKSAPRSPANSATMCASQPRPGFALRGDARARSRARSIRRYPTRTAPTPGSLWPLPRPSTLASLLSGNTLSARRPHKFSACRSSSGVGLESADITNILPHPGKA